MALNVPTKAEFLVPRLKRALLCVILVLVLIPTDSRGNENDQYIINPANDISLSLTALLTTGIGTYLFSQMQIPDNRNRKSTSDLFFWDRKFAGRYSETADLMSDVGSLLAVTPLAIGGAALYSGNSSKEQFWTFTLMFSQALLFQHGINVAFRSMEVWPRPYIFATEGKGKKKAEEAEAEAYGSFFSGHASAAFTVAVFTSEWFNETHTNPDAQRVVRALAFSLAGFESVLRVAAGKHYPTDILVGAAIGTGVSYGILEMHKKKNQMYSLWVGPSAAGITFNFENFL